MKLHRARIRLRQTITAVRRLASPMAWVYDLPMSEIIFEVREDETEGGYMASALGYGIHTQAETIDELRERVKEAADCYFDETMDAP